MSARDRFLFYILYDEEYTNKFSIDISMCEKVFKNAIISRAHPIRDKDLIPGNFVISYDSYNMELFKVVTINDEWFTVAHNNDLKTVFYQKSEPLSCICLELRITFHYKVSKKDLINIIDCVKRGIAEYMMAQAIACDMDSVSIETDAPIENVDSIKDVEGVEVEGVEVEGVEVEGVEVEDVECVEEAPKTFVRKMSVEYSPPERTFIRRMSKYLGNISRSFSQYINTPKPKKPKVKKLHWIFRLASCSW